MLEMNTAHVSCYVCCLCWDFFFRKPVKSVDFHSYVKDLERDSGLLFAVEYEVSLNHNVWL